MNFRGQPLKVGDSQEQAPPEFERFFELFEQLVGGRIGYPACLDGGKIWLGEADAAAHLIEGQLHF